VAVGGDGGKIAKCFEKLQQSYAPFQVLKPTPIPFIPEIVCYCIKPTFLILKLCIKPIPIPIPFQDASGNPTASVLLGGE
jgi:hypothetical protein